MELWIRSQDKRTLIQPNRIDIDDKAIIVWQNNYNCDETYLGTYKTKERALEVLDEIQQLLQPKGIIKFSGLLDLETIKKVKEDFENKYLIFGNNIKYFKEPKTIVYEMPID